ncbi:hypothetical protein F5B22DRAFT_641315 [Xylaria bambusicola]|uniref:uncharacterized protein n=1 Tax=Xylaria bambusicola TaxID=326684 RepID=UPI0020084114|nr:uncharacterized protein F5B22DRAFT_641315 [Xylaria bambusicola]KAI0526169.1 hypothetical protein F5B22DRAFT_641315 [Xylaria bambusicola]
MAAADQKNLPPLPIQDGRSSIKAENAFSAETYIQLLEDENEQLRLRNKELSQEVKALVTQIQAEKGNRKLLMEDIQKHDQELEQRDNIVSGMANVIVQEFQRYKEILESAKKEKEEITIGYSYFESASPI